MPNPHVLAVYMRECARRSPHEPCPAYKEDAWPELCACYQRAARRAYAERLFSPAFWRISAFIVGVIGWLSWEWLSRS